MLTTVRFHLPSAVGAESVVLVGDFNGWSPTETPMRRAAEGFVAEVRLQPGRTYRYRYLLDDERWENDWDADRYAANPFGGEDSLIDVPDHEDALPGGRARATIATDPRREWFRSAVIGACAIIAITSLWVGGRASGLGPAAAGAHAGTPAQEAAEVRSC